MGDDLLVFSRARLESSLEGMSPRKRVAFAAAAAERLQSAYARFNARTGLGEPSRLADLLQLAWSSVLAARTVEDAAVSAAEALIPDHRHGPWVPEIDAADDAVAAVAYVLRAARSGSASDAASSAQRVCDALDSWIADRDGVNFNDPNAASRVAGDALIQAELRRQQRDLHDLLRAPDPLDPEVVQSVRQRAQTDAAVLFGVSRP